MTVKLYYVADMVFEINDDPIAIGDGYSPVEAPYDGEVLGTRSGPKVKGRIEDAGTGAGSYTEIQIRNGTTGRDYLSTTGKFNVDSKDANDRAPLEGAAIITNPTFRAGDMFYLDVDDLPTNSDSARLMVYVTCGFWREVD